VWCVVLIAEFVRRLNSDLKNEWRHMCYYLYAASAATGLHAHEYKEFFLEQAKSEMGHVTQFSDLIIGLGGTATVECLPFAKYTDVRDLLCYAAVLEAEVVSNYTKRIAELADIVEDAPAIAAHKKWLEIFLEEQIKDSREDLDHLRQIMKPWPCDTLVKEED
jgi:ferritin